MADILVVDDERDIRELVADILKDEGHGPRLAWDSDSAFSAINEAAPDLVILDIWLKDSQFDGIDILASIKRDNPAVPVVIISGHGNIEIAVAAVKQGAYDFIEKPFNIDQLMVVIKRALEASRLRRENAAYRNKEATSFEMTGDGPVFRALRAQLDKVARGNGRVMLSGPAGAGKEVAARYIHANSDRASAPFITASSASISPDKMEEVLFGYITPERGLVPGLFDRAHGGILFFDEVADMPLGTQSKILRVLVEQAFTRAGGSDLVRVDVRVLSATTRDLKALITAGSFREELYHRLNVLPIAVPSLAERREDIPLLVRHFIAELNGTQGLALRKLSEDAEAHLLSLPWPGNVRQLRNVIERCLILGSDPGPISVDELGSEKPIDAVNAVETVISRSFIGMALRDAREVFEREYLLAQINRFGGNISRTANFIGMERSALHRKLKALDIIVDTRSNIARSQSSGHAGRVK